MAAPERSRRRAGRVSCDWEAAFAYWAALPAEQRSYQAVAAKFGVSIRTVERHGREGGWRQRLSDINRRAAAETDVRLGEAKVAYVGRLRTLMEATLVGYADKLRRGDVRFSLLRVRVGSRRARHMKCQNARNP